MLLKTPVMVLRVNPARRVLSSSTFFQRPHAAELRQLRLGRLHPAGDQVQRAAQNLGGQFGILPEGGALDPRRPDAKRWKILSHAPGTVYRGDPAERTSRRRYLTEGLHADGVRPPADLHAHAAAQQQVEMFGMLPRRQDHVALLEAHFPGEQCRAGELRLRQPSQKKNVPSGSRTALSHPPWVRIPRKMHFS